MRSFLRYAFQALVLVLVALISMMIAMRVAIHGREENIPNLIGKTTAEAKLAAEEAGLQLVSERQYFSDTVPEGRVMSQVPEPGVKVRRGWQLTIAESLGRQRLDIPSVLGQSERAAQLNIQHRGLDLGTTTHISISDVAGGMVLAQDPSPHASGVSAPKINLLVTAPVPPQAFMMPNFSGQTAAQATSTLLAVGLRASNVVTTAAVEPFDPSINAPPVPHVGVIAVQSPSAGSRVVPGTPIVFTTR